MLGGHLPEGPSALCRLALKVQGCESPPRLAEVWLEGGLYIGEGWAFPPGPRTEPAGGPFEPSAAPRGSQDGAVTESSVRENK